MTTMKFMPAEPGGGRPTSVSGAPTHPAFDRRAEERRRIAAHVAAAEVTELYIHVRHVLLTVHARSQHMALRALYQRTALHTNLSDRVIERRANTAYLLRTVFMRVFRHLHAGDFTYPIAEVVTEQGFTIQDPEALEDYLARVLPFALQPGMTVTKLRRIAHRVAESLCETPIEERAFDTHRELTHGGVTVTPLNDGFVSLQVILTAVEGLAARDRIRKIAAMKHQSERDLRSSSPLSSHTAPRQCPDDLGDSPFSMGQLEHQTAAELLTGTLDREHHTIKGEVRVTVPLFSLETGSSRHSLTELQQRVGTLAGLSGNATLEGYGPVPVGHVSQVCGMQREWHRMFINPDTGVVLSTDTRKPSAALKRFLMFRDPTCRWPGCNASAEHCDTDHTIEWRYIHDTSPGNTEHLCRRHHVSRHNTGVNVTQLGGGVLQWRFPNGRTIIDAPLSIPPQRPIGKRGSGVRFTPEPPPPF